jgi:hypothetical protein
MNLASDHRACLLRAAVGFALVPADRARAATAPPLARRLARREPGATRRAGALRPAGGDGATSYRAVQGGVGNFGFPVATSSGQTITCLPSCHWVVTAFWAI